MAINLNLRRFVSAVCVLALAAAAELPRRTAGHYQVTLRLPAEGLYAQEESQIEFRIEDVSRPDPLTGYTPVVRATAKATIDMPAMPRMPEFTETAHAEPAPGDYGIHPTFAHGGEYRLRIAVDDATVEFPLTVNDAQARRKTVPPRFTLALAAKKDGLRLTVRDRDTNSVVTQFETVHERKLHLIMVRRDLEFFAHEHPTLNADGTFTLTYTFPAPGEYHLFADTAPQGAGGQILMAKVTVRGKAEPIRRDHEDSLGEFPARKTVPIRVPAPGEALEPWLGVIGHLILIHEDAQTFVHCHPDDSGGLTFLARFPKAGPYRAWLQYQSGGVVHTIGYSVHAR